MDLNTWAGLVEVAFASRRPQSIAALFAEDGWRVEHTARPTEAVGRSAIARRVGRWLESVPDYELRLVAVHGDDQLRVLEWEFTGTSSAAPGGRPASLSGVSVCRMDGDLIAMERAYYDTGMFHPVRAA